MRRLALVSVLLLCLCSCRASLAPPPPIKVGVLHSLTGTMAISEMPVRDAVLMAIEEINAEGGVMGRLIVPVVADGGSSPDQFAQQARKLIVQDKVATVFGCWTSSSRKTVVPVFQELDNLLIYPVQYEGLEQSPNVVYTGAAPNQQIIPAVTWSVEHLGKRIFLVGSDYVFPRTANAIIRAQAQALGAEVVGEEYVLLGSTDVSKAVAAIRAAHPDVVLNTINGDTNLTFFKAMRAAGLTPDKVPTMSFSIAEHELRSLDRAAMAGDYATWNYFQSTPGTVNESFVRRFKQRYGPERVTDDPIEAAYIGVHLWAQAVNDAGSDDVASIRRCIKRQCYEAPEGLVYVDPETQHTWKTVRIGKILPDGQFEQVWESDSPVRPTPYPPYRTQPDWQLFLDQLYDGWGNRWFNPGP